MEGEGKGVGGGGSGSEHLSEGSTLIWGASHVDRISAKPRLSAGRALVGLLLPPSTNSHSSTGLRREWKYRLLCYGVEWIVALSSSPEKHLDVSCAVHSWRMHNTQEAQETWQWVKHNNSFLGVNLTVFVPTTVLRVCKCLVYFT